MKTELNVLCKCGCGKRVNSGRQYIRGHQNIGRHQTKTEKQHHRSANQNKILTKDHKIKIGKGNKGKIRTEETLIKLRMSHLGKTGYWNGKKFSEEHIKNLRISHTGLRQTEATKQKHREIAIKRMLWLNTRGWKQTSIEKTVEQYLNVKYPNQWKYTGLGGIAIANQIPDFININGDKLVIEVNGCYWHGCERCFPRKKCPGNALKDEIRKNRYESFGYKCVFIFEHDIRNSNKYMEQIDNFIGVTDG